MSEESKHFGFIFLHISELIGTKFNVLVKLETDHPDTSLYVELSYS